jgi:hypothetical protein
MLMGGPRQKPWGKAIQPLKLTFLIVFKARVVSFNLTFSPKVSEWSRFCWTFGNHVRFVLCFENGTLFPDCRIFP